MKFDFLSIRKSVEVLSGRVAELRREIEAKKRQREETASAPAARSDVIQWASELIDREAAIYPARLSTLLAHPIGGNLSPTAVMHGEIIGKPTNDRGAEVPSMTQTFAFVFNEQLKAGIAGAIKQMPWPGPEGLPMAQRTKELERLDKDISNLEKELKGILKEAEAAGIQI